MENELVKLKVVGITYNQIENGMYALILEEEEGSMRMPIIIGYNEAQSIECLLQKIATPRPLTHEFTTRILNAFDICIDHVVIKLLPNGIFTADVNLTKGEETHTIDARSSDAIAMAMRTDAPIYISREILNKCGVTKDAALHTGSRFIPNQSIPARQAVERVKRPSANHLADVSDLDLEIMMQKAVEEENYERADEIKKEIDRRQQA